MRKKFLIVSSSLSTGGLEKCLLMLCDSLDHDKYDVDLYLFNEGRQLLSKLNKNVNLLPDSPYYALTYSRSVTKSILCLLARRQFRLCLHRISRFVRTRFGRKLNTVKDWEQMKRTMLKLDTHYDIAIGFEEESACYYIADCVDADVKCCWVHTDIKAIDTNPELDRRAFSVADYICTVSENSRNSLMELYPEFAAKYRVFMMPSLQDPGNMLRLAHAPCELADRQGFKLLSVGRLVELKGFHLCVKSLKMLRDDGLDATWYVAGDGPFRKELEEEIARYSLQDHFILLGNCENPYCYMLNADVCVQPSSYEGLHVTVWEEKMLSKPVVVSDIPAHRELITDGENGMVTCRDSDSIYSAVKSLLEDAKLREVLGQAPCSKACTRQQTICAIQATFEKA